MGQPPPKKQYSAEEMRAEIIAAVERLDPAFLRVVHAMMLTYTEVREGEIAGYEADGTPVTVDEFNKQAAELDEEVARGDMTPADEFFKETIGWLKST